jgi:hypothetical protein
VIGESDFGWGDTAAESPRAFGGVGSAALVVASGLYCAAIWFASGLQPLPYLASRLRARNGHSPQGAKSTQ